MSDNSSKIIDVAVKYGYDSPDSFSRAFQALHGITLKEARKKGTLLKMIPPMTFQLTIHGGNEMDYHITEKEAFYIVGLKKRVSLQYHGVNSEIAAMWESLTEEGIAKLKQLSNADPRGLISATLNFAVDRGEGTKDRSFYGMKIKIPACWIFTAKSGFRSKNRESLVRGLNCKRPNSRENLSGRRINMNVILTIVSPSTDR